MMPRDNLDCKVYVGELGNNGDQHELEEAFGYYGPLRNVWVARNPPGFAFIEFEDSRDAEDAVKGLNGRKVCGRHIAVEMSNGKRRAPMRGRRGGRDMDQGCFNCGSLDHYARECNRRDRYRRRSGSRPRGRSPRGRSPYGRASPYGRSRSRSRSPRRKESR